MFKENDIKYIFFAGDLVTLKVVEDLEANTSAEIICVYGNMDKHEVKKKYPRVAEAEILGYKIKMAHMLHLIPYKKENLDIVIHGHTHKEEVSQYGKTVLINPGSGTGAGNYRARSIALVYLSKAGITTTIKKF